jgi:hypothetical protein
MADGKLPKTLSDKQMGLPDRSVHKNLPTKTFWQKHFGGGADWETNRK